MLHLQLMHACASHDLVAVMQVLAKSDDPSGLLATMFVRPTQEGLLPADLWTQKPEAMQSTELYSWGVGHNFQLGYVKDKQTYPKRIAFSSSIFDMQ